MRYLFSFLSIALCTVISLAQAPDLISYQAVVRDATNELVKNETIALRMSILQGSASGTEVFTETHSVSSNDNGLVSLQIGGGTPETGSISAINWSVGPYFIKMEADIDGGTNYTISGTSQLLSVPYALHANVSDSLAGVSTSQLALQSDLDDALDLIEELQLGQGVTDVENNHYSVVKIGDQIWMAENLRTTRLNDGTPIANIELADNATWAATTDPAYTGSGEERYGMYYNGYVMETGNVCPVGWHIPSVIETYVLFNTLGGHATGGDKLKATWDWTEPDGGTDEYGFSLFPAGYRHESLALIILANTRGVFWTTDAAYSSISISNNNSQIFSGNQDATSGVPIRCLKD
jgi:uncharacterized protein (TIGR02145 family)